MTPQRWHIADEIAAEARHQRRAEAIADAEARLASQGCPVRLGQVRIAHQVTIAQMARALRVTEQDVTAIEAAGLAAGQDRVAAYLGVLTLHLDGDTAWFGDTRIPLA
jgi:hypothetical protein